MGGVRRFLVGTVAVTLFVTFVPVGSLARGRRSAPGPLVTDVRVGEPSYLQRRPLRFRPGLRREALRVPGRTQPFGPPVTPDDVGQIRAWLASDAVAGVYLKDYQLRGVGENIEVWVAHDRDPISTNLYFPKGDCRNGARTRITDEQVQYLIDEYDNTILPAESSAFSVAQPHDGSNALLPTLPNVNLPADYFAGDGTNVVALIDNVRDANFYDRNNSKNLAYTAGFFSGAFNVLVDRNVMTIDAWDWLHRTGASPPDEPVPGNNCTSAPARPFLYEGVFAHEYQHLLEFYEDVDEFPWVNEGLSDWAMYLTNYVTPDVPITDTGFNSHIQCFLGFSSLQTPANPNPHPGGAENSLTRWGDQGEDELLCDYGAAFSFILMLDQRYGQDFITALHREDANGLEGLQTLLDAEGATAADVLHQWAAAVALDGLLDDGAALTGGAEADYTVDALNATIRWNAPNGYSSHGAPPNGSDYVRLRDANGAFLGAGSLEQLSFDGAERLAPLPVRWWVDRSPPQHGANPALFSGSGTNFDRAIVRPVRVRAANPWLTVDTRWLTERTWDFGFVQVSSDGGRTYRSLDNRYTTRAANPQAVAAVRDNLPGLTGNSKGWQRIRFNLERYAGRRVLLAFRYVTDGLVDGPGWWIDRVALGKNVLSLGRKLGGWRSPTQIRRTPVSGWSVQLVAYTGDGSEAWLAPVNLGPGFAATLDAQQIEDAVGGNAEFVSAIVTYDEPTETIGQYAPYRLVVNGARQPGG
jgi:hypothetical protein